MYSLATLALIIVLFSDIRILKKKNKEEFLSVFQISKHLFFVFIVGCAVFIFLDAKEMNALSIFNVMFVFPVYFYKRSQFIRKFKEDTRFQIVSSGMSVILYWFFSVLIFSVSMSQINIFYEGLFEELEEMVLSAIFSSCALMILIERYARIFRRGNFWRNVGFSKERVSFLLKIVFPAFLGLGMAYFSATIITERGLQPDTPLSEILENSTSFWSIPLFVFLALVVAPLVEEITFRGYFFEVLKKIKGQRFAFYVISLTFGALHMAQYWGDWAAISVIMIMGFVLTFVRVLSQTTAASVCTHYFYNIGVVVIATILEIAKGNL